MLQAGARELLPAERVSVCQRRPIPGHEGVSVLYSPKHKAAHFGGLQVCGSVWACPVCMTKITERRREELQAGVDAWGGQILLCTFTLQHSSADAVAELLGDLLTASHKLRNGAPWVRFQARYGVAGTVRSLENTYGANGHHPHLHMLFFVAGGIDAEGFTRDLRERWLHVVGKVGRYASPRWGLDVRYTTADIADYVAKWGKEPTWTVAHELTKQAAKDAAGASMPQLLELFTVAGDDAAGAIWRSFALAFKGKKQLVWSRGLRGRLGLLEQDKEDIEVATEEVEDAEVLAVLSLFQWRVILANDARAELLDIASAGDVFAVLDFVYCLVDLANGKVAIDGT